MQDFKQVSERKQTLLNFLMYILLLGETTQTMERG